MLDLDPDGKQKPILSSTVQAFVIPANQGAYLYFGRDAAWEQAVVVFVNGQRLADQLGSFNRKTFVVIGKTGGSQAVTLVGWHKRGGPDGSLPWVASKGKTQGGTVAWDDSADDGDYNDCKVKVVIE